MMSKLFPILFASLVFARSGLSQKGIDPYHLDHHTTDEVQFRTDLIRYAISGKDTVWYIPRGDTVSGPAHDSTYKWVVRKFSRNPKSGWVDSTVSPSFLLINDFKVDAAGQLAIIGQRADTNSVTYSNASAPVSYNLVDPSAGLNCEDSFPITEGSGEFSFDSSGFIEVRKAADNSIQFIHATDKPFYTVDALGQTAGVQFSPVYSVSSDFFTCALVPGAKPRYVLYRCATGSRQFMTIAGQDNLDSLGHVWGPLLITKLGDTYKIYDARTLTTFSGDYAKVKRLGDGVLILKQKTGPGWDYLIKDKFGTVCTGDRKDSPADIYYFPGAHAQWLDVYSTPIANMSFSPVTNCPDSVSPPVFDIPDGQVYPMMEMGKNVFFLTLDKTGGVFLSRLLLSGASFPSRRLPIGLAVSRLRLYRVRPTGAPRFLLVTYGPSSGVASAYLLNWDKANSTFQLDNLFQNLQAVHLPEMENRFFSARVDNSNWLVLDLEMDGSARNILIANDSVRTIDPITFVGKGSGRRFYYRYHTDMGGWKLKRYQP